jgi:hypothetical protein
LFGVHEGWPTADALLLGVSAAAASLAHPTCSEGVGCAADCRKLAARFGLKPGE